MSDENLDSNETLMHQKLKGALIKFEKLGNYFLILSAEIGGLIGFIMFGASVYQWLIKGYWIEQSLLKYGNIVDSGAIGFDRIANAFLNLHPIFTLPILFIFCTWIIYKIIQFIFEIIFILIIQTEKLIKQ